MRGTSGAIVDSKVVELQLDNSNFEQNASSTISTVQKLQEALDFSVSGKNFDNINASVKKVNFDPINQGIETAKNGFSALEAVAFGAFTNIGVKISNLGMRLVSAIPRQIIEGGKSRAFNMEQAKFQIDGLAESMEGMADAWDRIYKEADYAVGGTAYGLDVAAKAASQLMASGVAFGDTFDAGSGSSPMAKALRGISGVAAMSNSSYEEISSIFTKIAGQGRMMGEEINQIASRGLNASATIAQFINGENNMWDNASESVINYCKELSGGVAVTEADIREFASKGKISFELFSEAMDAAYGEHATKANETFTGSLTNIKAQLSKIGEVFASPLLANGQKVFSKLYEVIKDIRLIIADSAFVKGFENLANTVGDTLAGAFEKAHNFLRQFTKDSKKTKETQNAIETVAQIVDKKTGIGAKLREYFGISEVADEVEDDTKRINSSFESVKDTVIATIRGDFGNGLSRINALTEEGFDPETIQNYVNQLWELTGHDWSKLSDDIYAQVEAQGALGEVTAETSDKTKSGNKEIEQSMGPVEHVLSGLLNLWTGINNVVGIVREKIQGAMGAITGKGGALEKIAETFDNIAISFSTFTSEHGDEIAAVFDGIVNAVLLVIGVFGLAGQAIWNVVGGALEGLGTSLWDIVVWISNTITAIRNWITENKIVEKSLGAIKSVASTVTGKIKDLWNAFTSLPFVKKSIDAFSKAFGFVGEQFSSITEKGGKVLGNFWSMLKNGFKYSADPKQMWENVKNSFSYLWNQIKSSEVIGKFGDAFNTVKTAISDYFIDLGKNEDGSLNTFGRLQNGFSKFFSGIGNTVQQFQKDGDFKNLFTNIGLSFKGLWNNISASGVFDGIKTGFETIRTSIGNFIDNLGKSEDGSLNIFGKIWEGIKTFKDNLVNAFTGDPADIFKGIKDSFIGLWDSITGSGLGEKIGEIFTTAKDAVVGFLDSVGQNSDGSLNAFGKVWEKIKEAFSWITEKVGAARDKIGSFFKEFSLGEFAIDIFSKLKTGFGEFFTSLPGFFSGVKGKFGEFIEKVRELGGFSFDNLGNIWQAFKDTIGAYVKENNPFEALSTAFDGIKEKIIAKLGEMGVLERIAKIKAKITDFVNGIKGSVSKFKIPEAFEKFMDFFRGGDLGDLEQGAEKAKTVFGKIKDAIFGMFQSKESGGFNWSSLSGYIIRIVGALLLFKSLKSLGELVDPIRKFFDAFANEKNAKANFWKKAAIVEMASSIGILAFALVQIGSMKWDDLGTGIAGLISVVAMLGGLTIAISKFGDAKKIQNAGQSMLKMAESIAIMTAAIFALSMMFKYNSEGTEDAIWALIGIVAALAGVQIALSKLGGKNIGDVGKSILEMSGAIAILVATIFLLRGIEWGDFKSQAGKIAVLVGILAGVMLSTKLAGKNAQGAGIAVLAISAAIILLTASLKIIESIDENKVWPAVGVLAVLAAIASGLIIVGSLFESAKSAGIAIGACMVLLSASLFIVSLVNEDKLWPAVGAIAVLGIIAGGLLAVGGLFESGKSIAIGIGVMMALLAGSLVVVSLIDEDKLWPAVGAIAVLGAICMGIMAIAGLTHPSTLALLGMAAVTLVLGMVISELSNIEPERLSAVTTGLLAAFGGMAALLIAATIAGQFAGAAIIGLGIVLAFTAILGVIAWALGEFGSDSLIESINKGMDTIVAIFEGIGRAIGAFLNGITTEAFSGLEEIANDIVGFMRALKPLNDIGYVDCGPFFEALGLFATASLAGGLDGLLSFASEATEGVSAVSLVGDDIAKLAEGFKKYQETLKEFEGIDIDEGPLNEAIGSVTLAALAGFADGLASSLTEAVEGKSAVSLLADDMSALADGFSSYQESMMSFEGIDIDEGPLNEAIGSTALASLVGFADGLASTITEAQEGKTAVQTVSDDMGYLADGFSAFAETMKEYDGITIDTSGLEDLVGVIGKISFQGLLTSLGELILGDDDKTQVEQFAEDMGVLAGALTDWQTEIEKVGNITVPTDKIQELKGALDSVKEGGILDSILNFFGVDTSPDYSSFSEGIKGLGGAISDFSNSLGDDFNEGKMNVAVEAIKKLSEVGVALGDVDFGGWFSDGVLTQFADELIDVAPKLDEFAGSFTDTDQFAQISEAIKKLASGAARLASISFGTGQLTNTALVDAVKGNVDIISSMIEGLSDLDTSGVDKFTGAIEKLNGVDMSNAAQKLQEAQSNVTVDTSSSADTGKQMSDAIAGGIESTGITSALNTALATAISGVDTSAFRSLGATLSGDVAAGISSGGRTIKSVFSTVMDSAISVASDSAEKASFSIKEALESVIPAIPSSISVTSFNSIGTDIIDQISKGLSKGGNIAADLKNIVKDAKSEAADYTNSFKEVGSNFVSGLASGINSNRSEAITAAANVAAEALRRAKQELDIHSPSRKMVEVGKFFVLGFANGITRFTTTAIDRAEKMADATSEALMVAVNAASNFLDNDDYQPVITPVLDLSNIEAGASRLDTMLDIPKTMGLNFGAIEHNAEAIRDQRSNADILDALERLGENMNNSVTGDTYNINGVTYDDGSNVADAVSRLVDAARIGRRA